jgi:hypothetical protein
LRDFTGWRWRKTFDITTRTRFRLLVTAPWRKIDFHTWVSVRAFHPLLNALISFCTDFDS